jgi:hypothetical protein
MDANDVIAIIKRRQAKFQAQSRSSPRQDIDETAVVIVGEYDALLAEIEQASAIQLEAERINKEAEAEILGDQGKSGG